MSERPTAGDYLKVLRTTVPKMFDDIVELAKAEIKPSAKHGGLGVGMFGGAAVIGLTVLMLFMLTAAFALSMMYHELLGRNPLTALTLGFLTMAVLGLVLAAVLALLGKGQVSKVKAPTGTIAETMTSIGAVADAIESGGTNAAERRIPLDAHQVVAAARASRELVTPGDN